MRPIRGALAYNRRGSPFLTWQQMCFSTCYGHIFVGHDGAPSYIGL
jgi:hypothetical protein